MQIYVFSLCAKEFYIIKRSLIIISVFEKKYFHFFFIFPFISVLKLGAAVTMGVAKQLINFSLSIRINF